MLIAKVFQSGNSQAIRIPKEAKTDQQEFLSAKSEKGLSFSPRMTPGILSEKALA